MILLININYEFHYLKVTKTIIKQLLTGLTWLLVYRTEKYQKLKVEIEKSSKKRKF